MPASSFRFAAQRVLLTYSQVHEETTVEDIYWTIDELYPIKTYSLGKEQHQDGNWHIHACLVFKKKVESRDARLFDVATPHDSYHPNIEIIKPGMAHLERAMEYTQKEDTNPMSNFTRKMLYDEILDTAGDFEDYLRLVRIHHPRDYALNMERLEKVARKHFPTVGINTIEQFDMTSAMTIASELESIVLPQGRSTIVVGPAGCGKTTWAKLVAPKPCLFIRHLDSLSALTGNHRSIIFDDLDFKHLPVHAQKFLVDQENLAEIHVRYKVAKIPAGIVRIFTANEYPFHEGGVHGAAIDRRVNKIFV